MIASMQCLLRSAGNYLDRLGTRFHMLKSEIAGADFTTGTTLATDSIHLKGLPFQAIDFYQAHKLLGVSISMAGHFKAEKYHLRNSCLDYGYYALNQPQHLLRVSG